MSNRRTRRSTNWPGPPISAKRSQRVKICTGWEKSLPPLWTYFTSWFDYSHFSPAERCYIEKDYQLLYGRMLGLNERQEIPEEDYEL